jgi:hypothetical protein
MCERWHNFNWVYGNIDKLKMKIGQGYIFNIIERTDFSRNRDCETFHHAFVNRITAEYVLVADTWCWSYGNPKQSYARGSNIRVMKYKDFKDVIKRVNGTDNLNEINQLISTVFFIPFGEKKSPPFNEPVWIVPMMNNVLADTIRMLVRNAAFRDRLTALGGSNRTNKTKTKSTKRNINNKKGTRKHRYNKKTA